MLDCAFLTAETVREIQDVMALKEWPPDLRVNSIRAVDAWFGNVAALFQPTNVLIDLIGAKAEQDGRLVETLGLSLETRYADGQREVLAGIVLYALGQDVDGRRLTPLGWQQWKERTVRVD